MTTRGLMLMVALLSGCTSGGFLLVEPGLHRFGDMSLQNIRAWNSLPPHYVPGAADAVWTRHGTNLDSLIIFASIAPGERLFPPPGPSRDMPRYRSGMLPPELMALIETSFRLRLGESHAKVSTENLRLLPQGRFRFDINHTAHNGFAIRGTVLAGVERGQLWLVVYQAAAQHYFTHSLADIEALFDSLRFER